MTEILAALSVTMRELRAPRILAVLLLPMLGAILLWVILSVVFWDRWSLALSTLAADTGFGRWAEGIGDGWMLHAASALGVIVLVIPAILVTALVINEIIVMPTIVSHVATRYFPALEQRSGGTLIGSITNAVVAIAIFAVLWLITLPLWFTGIGALVVPLVLSAWLNQRLLRYDALSEHAAPHEYGAIVKSSQTRLYALGLALALLYYIPLVNLLAPVASGIAFTYLCLAELKRLRPSA